MPRILFLLYTVLLMTASPLWAQSSAFKEAITLDRQGFIVETIEPWKAFLETRPAPELDVFGHIKLCISLTKSGNLGDALKLAHKAAARYPDNFHAQFNLANMAGAIQKYSEAVTAFETLIKLDPNQGLSYVGLGLALFGEGKTERALDVLREVRTLFKKQKNIAWYQKVRIMIGQLKSFAPYPPDFSKLFLENNLENVRENYQKSLFLDFENSLNLP